MPIHIQIHIRLTSSFDEWVRMASFLRRMSPLTIKRRYIFNLNIMYNMSLILYCSSHTKKRNLFGKFEWIARLILNMWRWLTRGRPASWFTWLHCGHCHHLRDVARSNNELHVEERCIVSAMACLSSSIRCPGKAVSQEYRAAHGIGWREEGVGVLICIGWGCKKNTREKKICVCCAVM